MQFETNPNYLLRGVLAVVGAFIIFLGLNVGLGGVQTLGWQGGAADFLTVTNAAVFDVRDSHVRFIGGIWLATAGKHRDTQIPFGQYLAIAGWIQFISGADLLGLYLNWATGS